MEYLISLMLLLIGFVLGKAYSEIKIAKMLRGALESNGVDVDAEIEKIRNEEEKPNRVPKLIVEKHNDILYMYDKENNDFICQAKSIDELATLAKQYKNIPNAVVVHDNKIFMFLDGTSREFI